MCMMSRAKSIGPITTLTGYYPSDVISGRHLGWRHIRSAILDDLFSSRPFWMTSHPVGHVGWPISGLPYWMTSYPGYHVGWRHIMSAMLDDLISDRSCWMTSHPVGHVGWRILRSAILEWWHSAWHLIKCGRLFVFNSSAAENGGNICTSTVTLSMEKWRLYYCYPVRSRGFVMPQNQQNDIEDLDQPEHSENGEKV